MKTRTQSSNPDTRLILWGLKQRDAQLRSRALSESAEPSNRFFETVDTTIANVSNLVVAGIPLFHIALSILVNVLNSIPWISLILTTLNSLFRAVRSLVIKQIDPNKYYHFGMVGAYGKRVWFAAMGVAGVALGLTSMFVASLAVPFTIAATAVDSFNNIVKFGESIKRCFMPNPNQTRAQEVRRMLFKLENVAVSITSLTGTILLFTPLMPLGAGLLIASSLYALADKYRLNPFKHLFERLSNKIRPPVETKAVKEEARAAVENSADKKEERATLFEKLYCSKNEKPEVKAEKSAAALHTHPTRGNPMKLFHEPMKRPDVEAARPERNTSLRLH